jgi:hypothetical protein
VAPHRLLTPTFYKTQDDSSMPTYSKIGPPFNFLGHMTESQKIEFYKWLDSKSSSLSDEEKWWRIKAQQFRKCSGVLEAWQVSKGSGISSQWDKQVWEPGKHGHALYTQGDDQLPSVVMSDIKELFREQLKALEESVFQMNHLRTLIEKCEDKAQYTHEAPNTLPHLKAELDSLFGRPEYQTVLVKKVDESKFRVSQLDEITPLERERLGGKDSPKIGEGNVA